MRASEDLYELMGDLSTGWIRWLKTTATAGANDSPARWRVLRILFTAEQPVVMRALAQELGVAPRTVTDLIDVMARDGLVVRAPHPRDRRATILALTEAGEHRYRAITYSHLRSTAAAFASLNVDEQEIFSQLARRVLQAIDDTDNRVGSRAHATASGR